MTTDQILALARKDLGGAMESSARLCLSDALRARDAGLDADARGFALRSLRYSVGIFSPDYQRAERFVEATP